MAVKVWEATLKNILAPMYGNELIRILPEKYSYRREGTKIIPSGESKKSGLWKNFPVTGNREILFRKTRCGTTKEGGPWRPVRPWRGRPLWPPWPPWKGRHPQPYPPRPPWPPWTRRQPQPPRSPWTGSQPQPSQSSRPSRPPAFPVFVTFTTSTTSLMCLTLLAFSELLWRVLWKKWTLKFLSDRVTE